MADPPQLPPKPAQASWYNVWMFASSDELANSLVSTLIRRGYTVAPLGRQLVTKNENNPAVAIAFSVLRQPRDAEERSAWTASGVYNEVFDVIKFLKGKFWGVVVNCSAECTWNIGNISVEKENAILAKKMN